MSLATRPEVIPGTGSFAEISEGMPDWWWEGYVLFGRNTGFAGEGEVGKGSLMVDLAARISNGWPPPPWDWNDPDVPQGLFSTPGHVLMTSLEDDPSYTVKPRLVAAGARQGFVHDMTTVERGAANGARSVTSNLLLPHDLGEVARRIDRIGDVRAWFIDPLMSAAGTSVATNQKTRENFVEPMEAFARRRHIAIVWVNHFWRATTPANARDHMFGSKGLMDAFRAWNAIFKDPNDPDARVLINLKSNLHKVTGSPRFKIEGADPRTQVVYEQPAPSTGDGDRLQRHILKLLIEAQRPVSTQELATYLKLSGGIVRQILGKAEREGAVEQQHRSWVPAPALTAAPMARALGAVPAPGTVPHPVWRSA